MFLLDAIVKLQSQLVFQVHFQNQLLDFLYHLEGMSNAKLHGPNLWVYLMFANESSIALNTLNFYKHRMGKHMDIVKIYCPILTFIQTNRNIDNKFHKNHT
jgi:hypothetical protein